MNKSEFKSLGTINQLQHINNLEAMMVQRKELLKETEIENQTNKAYIRRLEYELKNMPDFPCEQCGELYKTEGEADLCCL